MAEVFLAIAGQVFYAYTKYNVDNIEYRLSIHIIPILTILIFSLFLYFIIL